MLYAQISQQDHALRDLREAASLNPHDTAIAEAICSLQGLNLSIQTTDLAQLWEDFVNGNSYAGEEIAKQGSAQRLTVLFTEPKNLSLLLERGVEISHKASGTILLKLSVCESKGIRSALIGKISSRIPKSVATFLECGPQGIEAFANVLADNWDDDEKRQSAIQEFITQLLKYVYEAKDEQIQARSLNALIGLLQAVILSNRLNFPFEALFCLLSSLHAETVRSRAIIVLSTVLSPKFPDPDVIASAKSQLERSIFTQFSSGSSFGYITAFSILASVFLARMDIAAETFLQDAFLDVLQDCLELDDAAVRISLLELLSHASVEKNCRTKVAEIADAWLQERIRSTDAEIKGLALSVLTKLSNVSQGKAQDIKGLIGVFSEAKAAKNEGALLAAVEGLAFASILGKNKEELSNVPFLSALMDVLGTTKSKTLVFGCLNILNNMTSYKPAPTEEEESVKRLRRLAKDEDQSADEFDDKIYVDRRCEMVLAAGLFPTLQQMAVDLSPASIGTLANILLHIASQSRLRPELARNGAVKYELSMLAKSLDEATQLSMAQALAKILISVNPILVFSPRTPITAPIKPLTILVANDSVATIARIEALLALTNLASVDDSARILIVDKAWTAIETLMLNETTLIQRSATELVCNLVVSDKGAEKFIPSRTVGATNRLHLLLALADVEDVPTRSAAGGALAMLTDLQDVCDAIQNVDRGLERLCRIVGDENEDVAFRGAICIRNMIQQSGKGVKGQLGPIGVSTKLKEIVQRTRDAKLKEVCKEVLAQLP